MVRAFFVGAFKPIAEAFFTLGTFKDTRARRGQMFPPRRQHLSSLPDPAFADLRRADGRLAVPGKICPLLDYYQRFSERKSRCYAAWGALGVRKEDL